MTNRRIDIDNDRRLAFRDGLFVYARTYGRHRIDVLVAPERTVSRGPLSEEPLLSRSQRIVLGLVLTIVFAVSGGILRGVLERTYDVSLPWMVPLALLCAGWLVWRTWKGRSRLVAQHTTLHFADHGETAIHVPHRMGKSRELDAVLEPLPTTTWIPFSCPPSVRFSFRTPIGEARRYAFLLFVGLLTIASWYIATAGTQRPLPFRFVVLMVCFSAPSAFHMFRAISLPSTLRAAMKAMMAGEYETATLMVRRVLEDSPHHPFANYCQATLATMRGDLRYAAVCVSAIQKTRLDKFMSRPAGSSLDLPHPPLLKALAQFADKHRSGTLDQESASRILSKAWSEHDQPAH